MSSMYILDAAGYPTSGAFAMSGVCVTGVSFEQWKQEKSAHLIDATPTTRRPAANQAVKVRNHVLLSSAQERSP